MAQQTEVPDEVVVYHLRDRNQELVDQWNIMFSDHPDTVKVTSL